MRWESCKFEALAYSILDSIPGDHVVALDCRAPDVLGTLFLSFDCILQRRCFATAQSSISPTIGDTSCAIFIYTLRPINFLACDSNNRLSSFRY